MSKNPKREPFFRWIGVVCGQFGWSVWNTIPKNENGRKRKNIVTYVHISTVTFSKVTSSIRPESIYNSNRLGSIIRMTVKIGSKKTTRNKSARKPFSCIWNSVFVFFCIFALFLFFLLLTISLSQSSHADCSAFVLRYTIVDTRELILYAVLLYRPHSSFDK